MSEKTPNASIDAAIKKLMKDCDGPLSAEQELGIKVKVEVIKAAMTWEKLKHNIVDKDAEGTEWGVPKDE